MAAQSDSIPSVNAVCSSCAIPRSANLHGAWKWVTSNPAPHSGTYAHTVTAAVTVQTTLASYTLGANVELGYFSQHAMEVLDPGKTVFETVQDAMPLANIGVIRNLLGAFLFPGDAVEKRIGNLSGGEKSRVVLATLLARPINFLVLDEPTNHLDIRSREILLDALREFTGTVVLVSHDRHFLRLLVDRVFEIDHAEMRVYEGTYDYYLGKVHEREVA